MTETLREALSRMPDLDNLVVGLLVGDVEYQLASASLVVSAVTRSWEGTVTAREGETLDAWIADAGVQVLGRLRLPDGRTGTIRIDRSYVGPGCVSVRVIGIGDAPF